jgi:hypothetical protein
MVLVHACLLALGMFATAEAAPVLVNGSLDGPVGPDTAATGWTIANSTPDIVNESGPFNKTDVPWTLSPDGGTFVRGNGHHSDPGQFSEAFEQEVSGFSVGESYTLEFFQTNLGFLDFDEWLNRDGHWGLFIDGNLVGQSTTISGPPTSDTPITWVSDGISFTATNATHTIRLQSFTDDESGIAYMGIDGLELIGTNVAIEERGMGDLKGAYLR